jgi:hypothetical protein
MRHTSALALALLAAGPALEFAANDNREWPGNTDHSTEMNGPAGNDRSGGDVVHLESNQDGLSLFAVAKDNQPSRVLASA